MSTVDVVRNTIQRLNDTLVKASTALGPKGRDLLLPQRIRDVLDEPWTR